MDSVSFPADAPAILLIEPEGRTSAELASALSEVGVVTAVVGLAVTALGISVGLVVIGPGVSTRAAAELCEQAAAMGSHPKILCVISDDIAEHRARLLSAGAAMVLGAGAPNTELARVASNLLNGATPNDTAQPTDHQEPTTEPLSSSVVAGLSPPAESDDRTSTTNLVPPPMSGRNLGETSRNNKVTQLLLLVAGSLLFAAVVYGVVIATAAAPLEIPNATVISSPPTVSAGAVPTRAGLPSTAAKPVANAPTPHASNAPSESAEPRPSSPPTLSPTGPTPLAPTISSLPIDPQRAKLIFTAVAPACADAPTSMVTQAVLSEPGAGKLTLSMGAQMDIGMLGIDGVFDMAGINPFSHWHGRLTTTGGAADYQVVTPTGCTQTYSVTIAFL